MSSILLIETETESPVSRSLHALGHSIIRIEFKEGAAPPDPIDTIPDIILWDRGINFSPLHFIREKSLSAVNIEIPEIVLLKTYDTQFLESWLGGNHYGFLVRPVSNSSLITMVENALSRPKLRKYHSINKSINQNHFLSTVIDSLPFSFIVINSKNYEVDLANAEAMRRSTGPNTHCYELTHNRTSPCSGKEHSCPLSKVAETGEPFSTYHHHHTPDGKTQYVEVKCYPIKDVFNEVSHVIEYETDITDWYNYQETLKKAKQAAEEANLAKSQFISTMSHELRTPLNIILGFSELLAQEESDRNKQEKLESIERAGKNLLAIINDILDFSEIESNTLKLKNEPFSLHSLLMHQYTFFKPQISSKEIDFNTYIDETLPPLFYGDQHRVHQIVNNLVSNAIKFTTKGNITVQCKYKDKKVMIEISDTGIGIAPERYGQLFTPFEQIDGSTNRSFNGTGLGLAIVKNLVDEMEGSIKVDSVPGKGSKFTVDLPLKPVQEKSL